MHGVTSPYFKSLKASLKAPTRGKMHANPLIEFMEGFFRQAYDGFCPEEYVVRTQSTYCTRSSSQGVCLRRLGAICTP